jgi:hypothetical protein
VRGSDPYHMPFDRYMSDALTRSWRETALDHGAHTTVNVNV